MERERGMDMGWELAFLLSFSVSLSVHPESPLEMNAFLTFQGGDSGCTYLSVGAFVWFSRYVVFLN